jgi:glycosyltransferase involved in cell wall biosynthesis
VGVLRVKVIALLSGLWYGGAQRSTLEFLEALREKRVMELEVVICRSADRRLILDLTSIGVKYHKVACREMFGLPIMHLNDATIRNVKESDLIWITDLEYLTVKYINEIEIPIVLHSHSYALACPIQTSFYRFEGECVKECSIQRILKCKNVQTSDLKFLGEKTLDIKDSIKTNYDRLLSVIKGPLNYAIWAWQANNVLRHISAYIFVSNKHRYLYVKHLPEILTKPNTTIYNIVTSPIKYVKVNIEEPYSDYLLYASGPNYTKGPHLLLKAWSKVSKEFRDLKLLMIRCKGTRIEELVMRTGLSNIILLDKLSPERLYHLMYKARAVVMPSLWPETFGRIPVEANRLGVPAIVSSAGGLPETIVDGITGYIFKAGDVNDLVKKIMWVLEKNFDRGEIIKFSYERINPLREVEKLVKFFESVISYGRRV